jgi:hypothetical protein
MLSAYVADYATRIAENAPLTMASIKAITHELHKPDSDRDLTRIEAMVLAGVWDWQLPAICAFARTEADLLCQLPS